MTSEIGQNVGVHHGAEANPTTCEWSPQGVTVLTWLSMPIINLTHRMAMRWTISHHLLPWKGYIGWSANLKTRIEICQPKWQQRIEKTIGEKMKPTATRIMMIPLETRKRAIPEQSRKRQNIPNDRYLRPAYIFLGHSRNSSCTWLS